MRLALARHDAILRQAVEAWHGQVYKVIGDAMQAAFALPAQALAAALAAQRELTAVAWPTSAPLRVRMWRSKQLEYALINNSLQRGRLSFQVATRRALDYAVGRAGLNVEETTRDGWVQVWNRLQPWPEAEQVLAAVKRGGYRIGALSNGDEAMLRAVLASLATPFDDIFASDHAGYYKPHPSMYALPLQARGIASHQILHVAGSATDVLGARSAGLPCAWSNRQHDRVLDPAYQANHEFVDLNGLLELLES